MSLSVGDLLDTPHLRLELQAGREGIGNRVTWAQTSDLDRPWEWMTGGELLMKNGRTLPSTPADQVALLEGLVANGISGLVLGIDPATPPLDPAAAAAADSLPLPVIFAPYSVGFAAIGRAVADATTADEGRRMAVTERVYTMIRRSVTQPARDGALTQLARDLACKLAVLDAETGRPVLDGTDAIPDGLRDALLTEVRRRDGALPGVVHLEVAGTRAQVVEVPDEEPTVLLTYAHRAAAPDIALLQHIATAAAVLLAQRGIRREHERRIGGELLAHLLDNRLDEDDALRQLSERNLVADDCVLVAARGGSETGEQHVHLSLDRRRIPNLLLKRSSLLYALLPASEDAISVLHRRLGPDTAIGISDPLSSPARAAAAVREANWAVRDAANAPSRLSKYADVTLLSVLRDTEEAQVVVDRVLGQLLRYDAEHGSDLTKTLDIFLTHDRSWQQAAAATGVHRQTVVYRMRRVEEITGRNLSATAHITELWLALRARDLLSTPG